MDLELKFSKNELSRIGILDIYIKRKLKHYFSNNLKINQKIQLKIINDWKNKKSINSPEELNKWLSLHEMDYKDWIELINSDYVWTAWCMKKI